MRKLLFVCLVLFATCKSQEPEVCYQCHYTASFEAHSIWPSGSKVYNEFDKTECVPFGTPFKLESIEVTKPKEGEAGSEFRLKKQCFKIVKE